MPRPADRPAVKPQFARGSLRNCLPTRAKNIPRYEDSPPQAGSMYVVVASWIDPTTARPCTALGPLIASGSPYSPARTPTQNDVERASLAVLTSTGTPSPEGIGPWFAELGITVSMAPPRNWPLVPTFTTAAPMVMP